MMDVNAIKELMRSMAENGITSLKISEKDESLELVCEGKSCYNVREFPVDEHEASKNAVIETVNKEEKTITAPIVGTFYSRPSPQAEPYVKVGDKISAGDTICIIESMKLMNEVTSDKSGTIVKILTEDGQGVEYGQPLMVIE